MPESRPEMPGSRPEMPESRLEMSESRPEMPESRPEMSESRPEMSESRLCVFLETGATLLSRCEQKQWPGWLWMPRSVSVIFWTQ